MTDDTLSAIRRRWSPNGGMGNDRRADDYTDPGCRILAEQAFRDVAHLLALLDGCAATVLREAAAAADMEAGTDTDIGGWLRHLANERDGGVHKPPEVDD